MNSGTILITGSSGLIGSHIGKLLIKMGFTVIPYDLKGEGGKYGDILDSDMLLKKINGVQGVIHLAAVSRVIDAQNNPELCWETNLVGTHNVVNAILSQDKAIRPWLVYASSREVYGVPREMPVSEAHRLRPVNVYGYAKVAAENIVKNTNAWGVNACVLRFSNVFGSATDHVTRVIPAFCHATLAQKDIKIEGPHNTFDFTYIDDVADAVCKVVENLENGRVLGVFHIVSGVETSLKKLVNIVFDVCGRKTNIKYYEPRNYDVSNFRGDGNLARKELRWEHKTTLEEGIKLLVNDIKALNNIP